MRFKLIILLVSMFLVGCAETYEYENVLGMVVQKEHDPAGYTTKKVMNLEGEFITKKVYENEEFEITVIFDGVEKEFEFDDDTLFNQVEVGSTLPLVLKKGLDAEGKVVSRNIELKIENRNQ